MIPMNRRGFIGALMASLAGTALAPETLLWRPPAADIALPLLHHDALVSIDHLTRAAIEQLIQRLHPGSQPNLVHVRPSSRGIPYFRRGDYMERVASSPVLLDEQLSIDMPVPNQLTEHGLPFEAYIVPTMALMANTAKEKRLAAFGLLQNVPQSPQSSVYIDNETGVALRGIYKVPLHSEAQSSVYIDNETGVALRGIYNPMQDYYGGPHIRFDVLGGRV